MTRRALHASAFSRISSLYFKDLVRTAQVMNLATKLPDFPALLRSRQITPIALIGPA